LSFLQLAVLAVVQGLTEFLPISSSGHLILVPHLLGWPDQGLTIDVAAHVGTLAAVLFYFWRDVLRMLLGLGRALRGKSDPGARLALYLAVATIPALVTGYLVEQYAAESFRSVGLVAGTMIGFGLLLFLADRAGLTIMRVDHMTMGQAIIIGLAQCIAFVPGVSRSGITMIAARFMGYERTEAARFSFLLSIPAIAAAGLWEGLNIYRNGSDAQFSDAAIVAALSALTGLFAIAILMRWLRNWGFGPFVIYRLLFGAALIAWLYYG
jgi:undecaprenyl-diphosphatase